MAGEKIPNMCLAEQMSFNDDGTLCLAQTPTPGPVTAQTCELFDQQDLHTALEALYSTAANFGVRFIKDGSVRREYLRRTAELSNEMRRAVQRGEMTAGAAARRANQVRNAILEASRLDSSQIGRAVAESLKATGLTLAEAQEKYALKRFSKAFDQLSELQKQKVYMEIVEASGRARPSATRSALRWGKLGKGLVALSIGLVVYDIWVSDDKFKAAVKGGASLGGGALGGAGGGALAGLVCGPGAPVCVGVGILIGGGLGAVSTDWFVDWLWD